MSVLREPAGVRMEHRIAIDAPASAVWALLTDMEHWGDWNPLCPQGKGRLTVGEPIDIIVALPGLKPQAARPVVTAVEPDRALRYLTTGFGGLMKGHRHFLIEPTGPSSCTFINGEIMSGPIGRLIGLLVGGRVRKGMQSMNKALKVTAEATVSPTSY